MLFAQCGADAGALYLCRLHDPLSVQRKNIAEICFCLCPNFILSGLGFGYPAIRRATEHQRANKKAADGQDSLPEQMDSDDTRNGIKACRAQADTKKARVLIADDVPLNLAVLKALLVKIGIRDIVTAVDGQDAWKKIQTSDKPFDLVLTDMWMPKMDGKELVAKIREDDRFVDLPVYAVTADIEEQKSFEEHGFTGILLKPVTIVKLSRLFN